MQYVRSKVDYVIGEFVYMLPSNMNLRIGKVKDYNNKILISSPSFKIGTNLKINLLSSDRRLSGDVKFKEIEMVRTEPKVITKPNIEPNEEHKQDVKPNIKFNRESKQDVHWALPFKHSLKGAQYKPDTNKITYEEEKVALILGTTAVFTVWWMFK